MPAKMYGQANVKAWNKEIDVDGGGVKVALLSSAYTFNQDTHVYFSDVVANEVTGTGYTAGGKTLGSVTVTYDPATNTMVIDGADMEWANSTITARYAAIYDSAPSTNATRPLIALLDFGVDKGSDAAAFTITWDATGIVRGTAA